MTSWQPLAQRAADASKHLHTMSFPSQYATALPNCTAGGKGGEALWRDWTNRAPPTQVQSSTTNHPNRKDGRPAPRNPNIDAARFELFGQLQCSPEFSKNPDLKGRSTVNRIKTDLAPQTDGSPLAMQMSIIEAGAHRNQLDMSGVRAGRRKNDITSMDSASPRGPGLILEAVPPQNVGGHGYLPPHRQCVKDQEMFPRNPVAMHPTSEMGRARVVERVGLQRTDLTGGSWEVSRAGVAPQAADPRRRMTEATTYGRGLVQGAQEHQSRLPQNHSWVPPPPLRREFGMHPPPPRVPTNDLCDAPSRTPDPPSPRLLPDSPAPPLPRSFLGLRSTPREARLEAKRTPRGTPRNPLVDPSNSPRPSMCALPRPHPRCRAGRSLTARALPQGLRHPLPQLDGRDELGCHALAAHHVRWTEPMIDHGKRAAAPADGSSRPRRWTTHV